MWSTSQVAWRPRPEALAAAAAACAAGLLHPCCRPHSPAQVASAVTRACQLPRSSTTAQRAAQLQSVARVSGAASLRRQQGAGMGAATRLSAVRAMATANGPVTKKVRRVLLETCCCAWRVNGVGMHCMESGMCNQSMRQPTLACMTALHTVPLFRSPQPTPPKQVYFDITIGDQPAGRITIGLYGGEHKALLQA